MGRKVMIRNMWLNVLFTLTCFYIRGAEALAFPLSEYVITVNNFTRPGEIVQRLVALPTNPKTNVTYSIEGSEYLAINSSTGEITWLPSMPPFTGKEGKISVSATADGESEVKVEVRLRADVDVCRCALNENVRVKMAENQLPVPLLYLGRKQCNEYKLRGSSALVVEEGQLVATGLDYEAETSVEGWLRCGNDSREVKVTVDVTDMVDQPPHIIFRDGRETKKTSFKQYNYEVDLNQHKGFLGGKDKKTLLVVFDPSGDKAKWKVNKVDPHNQLVITSENKMLIGNKALYKLGITSANKTLITSSTDIDIVFTDGNIDTSMPGSPANTMIYKFRFTLMSANNSLASLNLEPKYKLNLVKNAPMYTQVLQIAHNLSHILTFRLRAEPVVKSACVEFLGVTTHEGIVYVNDSIGLSECDDTLVIYRLSTSMAGQFRDSTIIITLQPDDEVMANTTNIMGCANYKYQANCESTGGLGTPRCQWKVLWSDNSSYSTCVPFDECLDGICSELEELNSSLCPQDCLAGEEWYISDKPGNSCPRGSRGLCPASGVCFCEENAKYCQCRNESVLEFNTFTDGPYSNDNNTKRGVININLPGEDEVCGVECTVIIAVVVAVFTIFIVVIVLRYKFKNSKRVHKVPGNINDWRVNGNNLDLSLTTCPNYEGSTPSTVISVFNDWPESHPYHNTGNMEVYDQKWELSRENLIIGDYIGEGEFGRVMKAQYKRCPRENWSSAAVKMLKDGASRVEFTDLLSEYTLLKEVDHPNVIRLIGAATLNGPFHLVVEYCEHGSLKNYLRNLLMEEPIYINGATQFYTKHARQLMDFSFQISKGMQYLSEIKLVHRDLATRNILIATDKVIKISDFGMTKDIYEEDAYKKKGQGRIPVKWMAPESLFHQIYTTKSDVWSFGIVLWEIATLGATPYPGIPAERMYNLLQEGYRMDRPETSSIALYTLMRKCWDYDPATRPSFKELKHSLEKMLDNDPPNLDLTVAARNQQACHGSTSTSTGSEEEGDVQQLTVALLPSTDSKFMADYLTSANGRNSDKSPLRYTTLEFGDDE